jgi:predicted choloylglycine hydrolase
MSLKHVEISGSHYEVGVALGMLSGEAIRTVVPEMERIKLLRSLWLGSDRLKQIEAAARAAFPQYMREMDGIAEGAEVPFEDIFIWNCRGDLPEHTDDNTEGALGCTTVMETSDSGAAIRITHNEDGHNILHGTCMMVTIHPENSTSVTSFYYPGMIMGHNFGFNEFGLVQTVNNISPHDQKVGLPRHIVSRASLACRSLDEAVRVFQRPDRASGFHYAIAQQGDDRLLSIEAPASNCIVHEIKGRNVHTNHLIFDEFRDSDQDIGPSSKHRQAKANALIGNTQGEEITALSILANTDNQEYPICLKQIDRHDVGYTLATAAFELTEQQCAWAVYEDPNDKPVLSGHFSPASSKSAE